LALLLEYVGTLEPVPAVPPLVAPEPFSFSTSVVVSVGVPVLPYVSSLVLVLSTLRSAVTYTCALPAPSVDASIALILDSTWRA
jgi:hypothetical protein